MQIGAIFQGVFAVLAIFGVNFSEDVRGVIVDNVELIVTALIALGAVLPAVQSAFKKKGQQ